MRLTDQQMAEFFDLGFLVLDDVLTETEVTMIRESFERLVVKARTFAATTFANDSQYVVENGRIDRVVWCAGQEPDILTTASDARLLVPVAQLLGSQKMSQLICQAHFKLPGDGVAFSWHQDSQHRKYGTEEWQDVNGKGSYVQTLIAIDDMAHDNGPVKFLRRSCQYGHIGPEGVAQMIAAARPSDFETMIMRPGSMALFGPYVIHGSEENRSNRPRRVLINGFCYPDANRRLYPGCGLGREVWAPDCDLPAPTNRDDMIAGINKNNL